MIISDKLIVILGCKVAQLLPFKYKHQLDVNKFGDLDEESAKRKSCSRNFKFHKDQKETNTVVALPPGQEYEFYADPSITSEYCAHIFPQVYQCRCIPTKLVPGSDTIEDCASVADCIDCSKINYGPNFQGPVTGFRIQVRKDNGHLNEAKAQVIGKSGATLDFDLMEMCRRSKVATCIQLPK